MIRPPPITVSAAEWGSPEICERPGVADSSEVSGTLENVLEGDLTQLVEKLHQFETGRLRQFVEDLQTALREVALEPNDRVSTDVATSPATSALVSPPADEIEHAAAEIAWEPDDRLATEVATSRAIPAPVSPPPNEIAHAAAEIAWEPDARLATEVAVSPVISAVVSSDEIQHSSEETSSEPLDHLETDIVTSPVICASASSPPDEIARAAEKVALEPSDRLGSDVVTSPVISAPVSSPPDKIEHKEKVVALGPSHRLGSDVIKSPVVSALVSSPPEKIGHAVEHPSIIRTPASNLMPNARRSSARSRSQWGKRTGLLLALSAVSASIPWEWPVLFANLPQLPSVKPELVVGRDTPEPSQRGQAAQEIVPIEGMASPATQAPSPPLPANDIEVLIDRGDQLFRQGDIIAARSFYERAAASGNARAASGVARTFDPQFLSRLGVIGIRGDPERAATWYLNAIHATDR